MSRSASTPAWKRAYCRKARSIRDRLTNKMLAKRLGLTEFQVRHCLDDSRAKPGDRS
jgi:hypothetical protein